MDVVKRTLPGKLHFLCGECRAITDFIYDHEEKRSEGSYPFVCSICQKERRKVLSKNTAYCFHCRRMQHVQLSGYRARSVDFIYTCLSCFFQFTRSEPFMEVGQ